LPLISLPTGVAPIDANHSLDTQLLKLRSLTEPDSSANRGRVLKVSSAPDSYVFGERADRAEAASGNSRRTRFRNFAGLRHDRNSLGHPPDGVCGGRPEGWLYIVDRMKDTINASC
jgi:hypothetical protein